LERRPTPIVVVVVGAKAKGERLDIEAGLGRVVVAVAAGGSVAGQVIESRAAAIQAPGSACRFMGFFGFGL
jgi:hypothetical protein